MLQLVSARTLNDLSPSLEKTVAFPDMLEQALQFLTLQDVDARRPASRRGRAKGSAFVVGFSVPGSLALTMLSPRFRFLLYEMSGVSSSVGAFKASFRAAWGILEL